ncbi:MAG: 3-keto-disaccharide hydrolase [Armatimonadota bacterium]
MTLRYFARLALVLGVCLSFCLFFIGPTGAASAKDKPAKPPKGAIVLFDGKDVSGWVHRGSGRPCAWKVENGYMEVVPGTGDIHTVREFGDARIHVEFCVPYMPEATGQARGNSGVYIQGLYEVQVLDSYGIEKPGLGDCGAIYGVAPPKVNAAKKPGEWQTYDITFYAPRFDSQGNMTQRARISVVWNGVKVHDNVEVGGRTTASVERDPSKPGPLLLQDHGCKVRYRNIWVLPLKSPK